MTPFARLTRHQVHLTLLVSCVWLSLVLPSSVATARVVHWTASAGGSWSTASNWQDNSVPGFNDTVVIAPSACAGGCVITLDTGPTSIGNLTLGRSNVETQTLGTSAPVLQVQHTLLVNLLGSTVHPGASLRLRSLPAQPVAEFVCAASTHSVSADAYTPSASCLYVNGTLEVSSGILRSSFAEPSLPHTVTVAPTGQLSLTGLASIIAQLKHVRVATHGRTTWTSGDVQMDAAVEWVNTGRVEVALGQTASLIASLGCSPCVWSNNGSVVVDNQANDTAVLRLGVPSFVQSPQASFTLTRGSVENTAQVSDVAGTLVTTSGHSFIQQLGLLMLRPGTQLLGDGLVSLRSQEYTYVGQGSRLHNVHVDRLSPLGVQGTVQVTGTLDWEGLRLDASVANNGGNSSACSVDVLNGATMHLRGNAVGQTKVLAGCTLRAAQPGATLLWSTNTVTLHLDAGAHIDTTPGANLHLNAPGTLLALDAASSVRTNGTTSVSLAAVATLLVFNTPWYNQEAGQASITRGTVQTEALVSQQGRMDIAPQGRLSVKNVDVYTGSVTQATGTDATELLLCDQCTMRGMRAANAGPTETVRIDVVTLLDRCTVTAQEADMDFVRAVRWTRGTLGGVYNVTLAGGVRVTESQATVAGTVRVAAGTSPGMDVDGVDNIQVVMLNAGAHLVLLPSSSMLVRSQTQFAGTGTLVVESGATVQVQQNAGNAASWRVACAVRLYGTLDITRGVVRLDAGVPRVDAMGSVTVAPLMQLQLQRPLNMYAGATLTGNGAVDVQASGALRCVANSSCTVAVASATVRDSASMHAELGASLFVSSSLSWLGGSVDGGSDGRVVLQGATTVSVGTGGTKQVSTVQLVNAGTLTWTGSNLQLRTQASLRNQGILTATAAGAGISCPDSSGCAMYNEPSGTIVGAVAGTDTAEIVVDTRNSGAVRVDSGKLRFDRFDQYGSSALTCLNGGTLVVFVHTRLHAGMLSGTDANGAKVDGNVDNRGGVVSPGVCQPASVATNPATASYGRMVIQSYEQLRAGNVRIQIGGRVAGSSYDVVAIQPPLPSNVETNATLSVLRMEPFVPVVGDEFDIMTWAIQTKRFAIAYAGLDPRAVQELYGDTVGLTLRIIGCPLGQYDVRACQPCAVGTFSNNASLVTCPECPRGQFNNATGLTRCFLCQPGSYSDQPGQGTCPPCAPGSFNNVSGQSTCDACPTGTFQSSQGRTTCDACPTGSFSNTTGQNQCHVCAPGTYQSQSGQSSACLPCAPGTFADAWGSDACTPCAPGSYATQGGQSSCTLCARGHVQPRNGSATGCEACVAGKHAPQEGMQVCVACLPGSYAASNGSANCSLCALGHYQPGNASVSCFPCGVGNSTQGRLGATQCTPCAPGTYANGTGRVCSNCTVGTFQNVSGSATCLPCDGAQAYADTSGLAQCKLCEFGTPRRSDNTSSSSSSSGGGGVGGNTECVQGDTFTRRKEPQPEEEDQPWVIVIPLFPLALCCCGGFAFVYQRRKEEKEEYSWQTVLDTANAKALKMVDIVDTHTYQLDVVADRLQTRLQAQHGADSSALQYRQQGERLANDRRSRTNSVMAGGAVTRLRGLTNFFREHPMDSGQPSQREANAADPSESASLLAPREENPYRNPKAARERDRRRRRETRAQELRVQALKQQHQQQKPHGSGVGAVQDTDVQQDGIGDTGRQRSGTVMGRLRAFTESMFAPPPPEAMPDDDDEWDDLDEGQGVPEPITRMSAAVSSVGARLRGRSRADSLLENQDKTQDDATDIEAIRMENLDQRDRMWEQQEQERLIQAEVEQMQAELAMLRGQLSSISVISMDASGSEQ